MSTNLIAKAAVFINAPVEKTWNALVNPAIIQQYMMGAIVSSDWKKGSAITWKGEFKGKSYEDKGRIINIVPDRQLQYTHFSPVAGLPDTPENYHTVTIDLKTKDNHTELLLTQDNNKTEKSKEESEKNWKMMLEGLKKVVEA